MDELGRGFDELRSKQTLHGDLNALMTALHVMSNDDDNYDDPLSFNHEDAPAVKQLCQWWNDNAPENYRHAGYFRLWHWNPHDGLFYSIGDAEMPTLTISEMSIMPSYSLFERFEVEDYDTMIVAVFYKSRDHNQLNNGYTEIHYADGQVAMSLGVKPKEVNDAWYCVHGLVDAARMYLYSGDEYQLSMPNADQIEQHPTPWRLETGGENFRPVVLDHNNAIVLIGFNGSTSNEVSDEVLEEIVTCVNACHRTAKTCDTQLTASGFNYTPNNIHELCTRIVKKAQSVFDDLTIVECYLWAYHHTGTPYLALDMSSGKDAYLSITMLTIGNYDLSNEEEPCLFDMVEAIHVAGIITQSLGIKNITIGNLNHETNREIPELPPKKS